MTSRTRIIAFHLVMWEIHPDYQGSASKIGNSAVPFIIEPDISWFRLYDSFGAYKRRHIQLIEDTRLAIIVYTVWDYFIVLLIGLCLDNVIRCRKVHPWCILICPHWIAIWMVHICDCCLCFK